MNGPQIPNSQPQGTEAYRQIAERQNRLAQTLQPFHPVAVTGNTTVSSTYGFYLCDATGGSLTVTLPMAGAYKGVRFYIKKVDATGNTVTIDGNGSETIDGAATQVIAIPMVCLTVVSDGTQWWIV